MISLGKNQIYKMYLPNRLRKSKVTAVLSVLFLSVVLTGFALLGIEGAGSPVGQCHFWAGIVTTVLSIGHILKRLPLLRKSLK